MSDLGDKDPLRIICRSQAGVLATWFRNGGTAASYYPRPLNVTVEDQQRIADLMIGWAREIESRHAIEPGSK